MNQFVIIGKIYGNLEVVGNGNSKRLVVNRNGKQMPPSLMVRQKFAKKDETGKYPNDFFPVSIFGNNADYVASHLAADGKIAVCGHLTTYKDKNNLTVIGLTADEVEVIDFKTDEAQQASAPQVAPMPTDDPFADISDNPFEANDPFADADNPFA